MAKAEKTTKKLPAKPFTGAEGNTFSKDNQPSPESKRKGWQQLRAERHLSQAIIKAMLGEDGKPTDTFKDYVRSLVHNAQAGNAKAIEAVNKFIEDDIQLLSMVDPDGKAVQPTVIIWGGREIKT